MKALSGFLILGCLLVAGSATAGVGTVTHLSGILSAKGSAGASKVLSVKSEVNEGDLLTTETETYARVKFVDGAEIVLRPGTQLRVAAYSFQLCGRMPDSPTYSGAAQAPYSHRPLPDQRWFARGYGIARKA